MTKANRKTKSSYLIYVYEKLNLIGSHKMFIGVAMILLNLISRYVELRLSKGQEMFLRNVGREILIFVVAFMGTRDIVIALILTGIFIILANYVFNEESKFCILPKNLKNLSSALDKNNDGVVSQKEVEDALKLLDKAKKQDKLHNQMNMINSLDISPMDV